MAQISDILRDISSVWGPKKSDIANCPSPQLSGVLGVHVNEIAAVNGLEAGKLGQWDVVSPAVPRLTSP